mmetsp:Transcript_27245/g.70013  ORF Transcript_27245/g.70013 Transcript_27245/m.70013 type:complete len:175 (+) Transcript_27245:1022-1546(+)
MYLATQYPACVGGTPPTRCVSVNCCNEIALVDCHCLCPLRRAQDLADDFGRSQDGILQYPQEVVMANLEEAWVTDASDPRCILNRVRTEDSRMASRDMPKLYKAAQAFVLPSHGEGWGLPLMEAMAMELPTIGTKFGGNVDFMDPSCSFLLDVGPPAPLRVCGTRAHPPFARDR